MNTSQESIQKQIQNTFHKTQVTTTQSNGNHFDLLTVCRASKSQETATQEIAEGDSCLNAFWGRKRKKKLLHRKYPTMKLSFGSVMPHPVCRRERNDIQENPSIENQKFVTWVFKAIFHYAYSDHDYRGYTHIPCNISQPEYTQWERIWLRLWWLGKERAQPSAEISQ